MSDEPLMPKRGDIWFTKRVRRGELVGDTVRVLNVSTVNATDKLWVEYKRSAPTGRTSRTMRILVPLTAFHKKFKPGKAIEK